MATSTLNTRMDSELKSQFEQIAANIGMSSSAVVNVFARQFVAERGFPFPVREPRPRYVDFESEQEVTDLMDKLSAEAMRDAW